MIKIKSLIKIKYLCLCCGYKWGIDINELRKNKRAERKWFMIRPYRVGATICPRCNNSFVAYKEEFIKE